MAQPESPHGLVAVDDTVGWGTIVPHDDEDTDDEEEEEFNDMLERTAEENKFKEFLRRIQLGEFIPHFETYAPEGGWSIDKFLDGDVIKDLLGNNKIQLTLGQQFYFVKGLLDEIKKRPDPPLPLVNLFTTIIYRLHVKLTIRRIEEAMTWGDHRDKDKLQELNAFLQSEEEEDRKLQAEREENERKLQAEREENERKLQAEREEDERKLQAERAEIKVLFDISTDAQLDAMGYFVKNQAGKYQFMVGKKNGGQRRRKKRSYKRKKTRRRRKRKKTPRHKRRRKKTRRRR